MLRGEIFGRGGGDVWDLKGRLGFSGRIVMRINVKRERERERERVVAGWSECPLVNVSHIKQSIPMLSVPSVPSREHEVNSRLFCSDITYTYLDIMQDCHSMRTLRWLWRV